LHELSKKLSYRIAKGVFGIFEEEGKLVAQLRLGVALEKKWGNSSKKTIDKWGNFRKLKVGYMVSRY